ncbi:MAG: hypothetical protein AAF387_16910, partial [Pseudomonadota bacterium]
MYTTKIFNSIQNVPADQWDAVSSNKAVVRSHAYFAAVEDSSDSDADYFYPVIYRNGQPVAHSCVYVISTDFSQMLPRFLQSMVLKLRK